MDGWKHRRWGHSNPRVLTVWPIDQLTKWVASLKNQIKSHLSCRRHRHHHHRRHHRHRRRHHHRHHHRRHRRLPVNKERSVDQWSSHADVQMNLPFLCALDFLLSDFDLDETEDDEAALVNSITDDKHKSTNKPRRINLLKSIFLSFLWVTNKHKNLFCVNLKRKVLIWIFSREKAANVNLPVGRE